MAGNRGIGKDVATVGVLGGVPSARMPVAAAARGGAVSLNAMQVLSGCVQRRTGSPDTARPDYRHVPYNFHGQHCRMQMIAPPGV